MSIIRAAERNNPLPLILYYRRYFEDYEAYHLKELKKIQDSLAGKTGLNLKITEIQIEFIKSVIDIIRLSRSDVDLMDNVCKFVRCLDDELTLLKNEARKTHLKDAYTSNEIKRMRGVVSKLEKDVQFLEKEKLYWDTIFRVRNIPVFKEESFVIFFPGEDSEAPEEPPTDLSGIKKVVIDFIQQNKYELAVTYIDGKMDSVTIPAKTAYLHSLKGSAYNEQGDYPNAIDQFTKCLKIRQGINKEGKEVTRTMHNLMLVLVKDKQLKEASTYIKQLTPFMFNNYNNTNIMACYYVLVGKIKTMMNLHDQAVPFYAKSVAILEKIELTEDYYYHVLSHLIKGCTRLNKTEDKDKYLTKFSEKLLYRHGAPKREIHLFQYLKAYGKDVDGKMLFDNYGSIEKHDVADFIEILENHFSIGGSRRVPNAIEEWKELSAQK